MTAMTSTAITNPTAGLSAWDPRLGSALKSHGSTAEDDVKLKKTCQEMEGVFLNMLLKSMRATVPKNSLDGESMHNETLQSMLDMEMTRNMAAAGGTGLAEMIYRNIKVQSEQKQKAEAAGVQPKR